MFGFAFFFGSQPEWEKQRICALVNSATWLVEGKIMLYDTKFIVSSSSALKKVPSSKINLSLPQKKNFYFFPAKYLSCPQVHLFF